MMIPIAKGGRGGARVGIAFALGAVSCVSSPAPSSSPAASQSAVAATAPASAAASGAAQADASGVTAGGAGAGAAGEPSSATGFRLESSLGVELRVPEAWQRDRESCPGVYLGVPAELKNWVTTTLCVREVPEERILRPQDTPDRRPVALTRRLSENEAVFVATYDRAKKKVGSAAGSGLPVRRVSLGDQAAFRAEGRGAGGVYLGWLDVRDLGVLVLARARRAQTVGQILDSVRVVDADRDGCPVSMPALSATAGRGPSASSLMVPTEPTSIAVCSYETSYEGQSHRLRSSARLTGEAARELAARLNRAPAGPNPAEAADMCPASSPPPPADFVLVVEGAFEKLPVYVKFSSCPGKRIDNGTRQAHVTLPLVQGLMRLLQAGSFGFVGHLPE